MDPYPRTWAEIDLGALQRNLAGIRKAIGEGPRICLVAKADAYGHGLAPVSRFALQNGADWLAVATVAEGISLRDAGIDARIMILSPILPVEVDQAVFYGLDVTLESLDLAESISEAAVRQGRQSQLHLKVDTGLHRFGCDPANAASLARSIRSLPGVTLAGISQHFIDSRSNPERTQQQFRIFQQCLDECHRAGIEFEVTHWANSAAAVQMPVPPGALVRVGLLAYGIDSSRLLDPPTQPVLQLKSRVVASRWIDPGETVGYNATFRAEQRTRVLTIGAGYGDGVPRSLSNRGFVEWGDHDLPIIGLVCMDQLMVDATSALEAKVGDVVTVIGRRATASRLAELAGTNSHEIVTRITPRAPRRFLYPKP